MKKTYLQPEVEVMDVLYSQPLLAGSSELGISDETVDTPGDLLAPGLPSVNDLLGIPGPGLPGLN